MRNERIALPKVKLYVKILIKRGYKYNSQQEYEEYLNGMYDTIVESGVKLN